MLRLARQGCYSIIFFIEIGGAFWKFLSAIDNALSMTGNLFTNSVGSKLSSLGSESLPELESPYVYLK